MHVLNLSISFHLLCIEVNVDQEQRRKFATVFVPDIQCDTNFIGIVFIFHNFVEDVAASIQIYAPPGPSSWNIPMDPTLVRPRGGMSTGVVSRMYIVYTDARILKRSKVLVMKCLEASRSFSTVLSENYITYRLRQLQTRIQFALRRR